MVMQVQKIREKIQRENLHPSKPNMTLIESTISEFLGTIDDQISKDLNTPTCLSALDAFLGLKSARTDEYLKVVSKVDELLGLGLMELKRTDLRIRPKAAVISETEIEEALERRKSARVEKDFATSDAIRDELSAKGVEVMDGDPLGWEWKLSN
jgi:cysteinyl-tRNA synthetase